MNSDARFFLVLGSLSAFAAVALGAFAAHLLKERLPAEMFSVFEVAVRYHMYHALALLGIGLACAQWPGAGVAPAGWLFCAGTVIFSGSLYCLALSGARWLGTITPAGGVCFLLGWVLLAWRIWKAV